MQTEKILLKLMRYCAYQERCPADIRKKVVQYQISEEETETLIKRLIEENYIDIKRYASAYARGKFNQNKWGKIKIIQGLQQKDIDEQCIEYGLSEIAQKDYLETLQKLIVQKWSNCKGKNDFEKKQKVAAFLQRKGYEPELFWQMINALKHKKAQ